MNIIQTKLLPIILVIFIVVLTTCSIYNQINEYYLQDDPKIQDLKRLFEKFFNKDKYWDPPLDMLNNRDVMKEIVIYRGEKSYTINKQKVFLCLKDEKGYYYSLNNLIYVLTHEIAHVLCDEIGHTTKFYDIFECLILKLIEDGIYNPSIPMDNNYCKNGDHEV